MELDGYKKFTDDAKTAIKGEAFFELLITDYAIPHHVVGAKDIGIDYFCEWVYGNKPTGILFAVQVKSSQISNKNYVPQLVKCDERCGLGQYKISYASLLDIKKNENTIKYWKGLGIPVYLFFVHQGKNEEMNCYYRRYTPFLTDPEGKDDAGEYSQEFYKVNKGFSFLGFADKNKRRGGFARHLFIDYIRCNYANGIIVGLKDKMGKLGLSDFKDFSAVYPLIEKHEDQIFKAYEETTEILNQFKEEKRKRKVG